MNKLTTSTFLFLMLLYFVTGQASAQEKLKHEHELFFTYIGTIFSGGMNQLEYSDWFDDSNRRETKDINGLFGSGGFVIHLIVNRVVGEATIQFMYNANDSYPVYHLFYSASGKYLFPVNQLFSFSAGLGFYFESAPSNRDYFGSGGGHLPLGIMINITRDLRLFGDLFIRYGYLGMGEDSFKLSYGINLGMTFKVGRI